MDPQIIAYLEELEDLGRAAQLCFRAENGGIVRLAGRVKGLQTAGNAAGFWADGLVWVPLEALISVDGRELYPMA